MSWSSSSLLMLREFGLVKPNSCSIFFFPCFYFTESAAQKTSWHRSLPKRERQRKRGSFKNGLHNGGFTLLNSHYSWWKLSYLTFSSLSYGAMTWVREPITAPTHQERMVLVQEWESPEKWNFLKRWWPPKGDRTRWRAKERHPNSWAGKRASTI